MEKQTIKRSSTLRFIEQDSKEYNELKYRQAISFCPPIIQCYDCGAPTVKGYCCGRCGSVDPRSGENSF